MAAPKHIHSEDVVRFLKTKDGSSKIGLVLRSGNNISDSEESSYSSDEDVKVKNGQLLVCWFPSGHEEVVNESKVELIDRSLQPGDVIRHSTKPNQKGYVKDIHVTADISILGTDRIIKNVDCKKYVSPLQRLSPNTYVSLGPWVGYIQRDYRRVVLWLKNGSRCSLEGDALDMLTDASDKRDEESPFYNSAFYPSQAVVGPADAFSSATWLTKIKPILVDQSKIKAVVEEAKVVELQVSWQVCGSLPPGCEKETYKKPPDKTVKEEDIEKVKVFYEHYQELQIGDKCFYVVKEEDIVDDENHTEKSKPLKEETSERLLDKDPIPNGPCSLNAQNEPINGEESLCDQALKTMERSCEQAEPTTVSDRDSVTSLSQVTISLTSIMSDNTDENNETTAHESDGNKPATHESDSDDGDVESDGADQANYKASKQSHSSKPSTRRRRRRIRHKRKQQLNCVKVKPGDKVCVEIIGTKTRADVIWQDGSLEKNVDTLDLIAIYHIDEHQFFPGYIVNDMRGSENSTVPTTFDKYGVVRSSSDVERTCAVMWFSCSGEDLGMEHDVSVYDLAETVDMVFNPGDLVVAVNAGNDGGSQHYGVAGQVVCVDQEGYVVVKWVGEQGSEPGKHRPHELYKVESEDSESEDSSDSDNSSGSEDWETASEDGHGEADDANSENRPNLIIPPAIPSQDEEPSSPRVVNVDVEALNNANSIENMSMQTGDCFEGEAFLMLSEVHVTHHYYEDHFVKNFTPDKPRKFMSVLRKEMLLLRSSLPSGILIRGFENAMELFTVLITGPKDTPYEGGIFLFDIKLPSDYPHSPPLVFFVSMTRSVFNPNLYVDGTVCTSLLGTWSGKDSETWTEKSNLLQVLLSIQALILCKEPYFNEAGFDKYKGTSEGAENARLYNEMAILHLLSSMTATVKLKHPIFEMEMRDHFKKHGLRTIERYKSWLLHATQLPQTDESLTLRENCCISSETSSQQTEHFNTPEFPLFPVSKGFCKCLERNIELFNQALREEKLTLNKDGS